MEAAALFFGVDISIAVGKTAALVSRYVHATDEHERANHLGVLDKIGLTRGQKYARIGYILKINDETCPQAKTLCPMASQRTIDRRDALHGRQGNGYGFSKNDQETITQDEQRALQFAGKAFLELTAQALSTALRSGVLLEVHCEQTDRITAWRPGRAS